MGNIDASEVANIGDVVGNILLEDLFVTKPDLVLTPTFDSGDPSGIAGVAPNLAD